jgi:PPOX class probable F420-dependent enzyme
MAVEYEALPTVIPESHRDLLTGPVYAGLTTVMPDGQPQTTVVWADYDGEHVLINTMRGFQKEKNMRANPRVTLLAFIPGEGRYLEVRGTVVEMTEDGALSHLDHLAEVYTSQPCYFGGVVPAELAESETPVLCRIAPTHVIAL